MPIMLIRIICWELLVGFLPAADGNGLADPTFNGGSSRLIAFPGGGQGWTERVASDGLGRIVVAGNASNGTDHDVACARFLADGTLDTSFAGSGSLRLSLSPYDDWLDQLIVTTDRIMLVAHYHDNATQLTTIIVKALTFAGDPDPTFGASGMISISYLEVTGVSAFAITDHRFLLVVSSGQLVGPPPWLLTSHITAFQANGVIDPAYGTNGSTLVNLGSLIWGRPQAQVSSDGRLLLASGGGDKTLTLAMLDKLGMPDAQFGVNGIVTVPWASPWANPSPLAIAFTPSGLARIALMVPVVSGGATLGNVPAFLGLTADGLRDETLGVNGIRTPPTALGDGITDLIPYPPTNGWILTTTNSNAIQVSRLTQLFEADGEFAGAGTTAGGMRSDLRIARSLTRADGSLIVASGADGFEVRAFTSTGAALPGFGPAYVAPGAPGDRAFSAHATVDGGVLLAGASGPRPALSRVDAAGLDDSTFAATGQFTADLGPNAFVSTVVPAPTGGWVVAGGKGDALLLGRLLADGTPDSSFGIGGWLTPNDSGGPASALVLSSTGNLLIANDVLREFLPDGSPNTAFGVDGVGPLPALPRDGERCHITRLIALTDGSLLAGGDFWNALSGPSSGPHTLVYRCNALGMPDLTYGDAGSYQRSGLGIVALVPTPSGRVLLVENTSRRVMALTASGALDPSYGTAGVATVEFIIRAMAVQGDGAALVVGCDATIRHGLVQRIAPNGSPDATFPLALISGEMGEVTACTLNTDADALYVAGASRGDIVLAKVTMSSASALPPADAPTFSPPPGEYGSIQSVTLSSLIPGATIRYTTDGSTPTFTSPLYHAPLSTAVSRTYRAKVFAPETSPSADSTASYTISLPPTIGGGSGSGTGTSEGGGGGSSSGCGSGGGLGGLAIGLLLLFDHRQRRRAKA